MGTAKTGSVACRYEHAPAGPLTVGAPTCFLDVLVMQSEYLFRYDADWKGKQRTQHEYGRHVRQPSVVGLGVTVVGDAN